MAVTPLPAGDQRVTLARRIYERTGSREDTRAGMLNLGYGAAETDAALATVAPAPAATPPAPAAPTPAAAGGTSARGNTTTPRTPPGRRSRRAAAGRLPRPTLSLPRRPSAGDVAGFGFGAVVYVLALQYIKHGPGGPTGWLGAKFLNRPYTPSTVVDEGAGTGGAGRHDDADLTTTRPTRPQEVAT